MEGVARWTMVALIFFTLVLLAGPTLWWLPLPIIGLGMVLLIPVFVLFVLVAPFLVVALVAKALLSRPRAQLQRAAPSLHEPAANRRPKQPAPNPKQGLFGKLIVEAEAKVDAMRTHARRIPKPGVRAQALDICAVADRILAVLSESADERLARDVVTRYFTPAETILSRYARLATREVASAGPALTRVEEEDLPLIERKFADFYDRLHRGDLIDLEVAREMLAFDFATARPSTAQV